MQSWLSRYHQLYTILTSFVCFFLSPDHFDFLFHFADPSRQIERKLVSVDKIVIGILNTSQGPPTALQLIRVVKIDGDCITVAANGNDVYVGAMGGTILKMNKLNQFEQFSKVPSSNIVGLTIHSNTLYFLNSHGIFQIDLKTMKQSSFFNHADKSSYRGSRMIVTQNQLVVADITNQRLTIYSLTGQLIRHVDCPSICGPDSWVSICLSPSNPNVIIVSDSQSSQVFAVNLTTGAVLWTNRDIRKPQGIASYGSEHDLVTKADRTTQLWVLSADTGMCHVIFWGG